MGQKTDDERAFQKTIAGFVLPTDPSAYDATVVPDEPHSWSSFRGSGPLPTIAATTPKDGGDAELSLVEIIGEGGMGRVYLATQRSLGRKVAVKTVKDLDSDRAVSALCDEAVVTGRLSHPNIIPVHALGRDVAGRPLLIMKRVEGVAWNDLLSDPEHPFWSRNEVSEDDRVLYHVDVLRKIAHAVELAHSEGIIHRDIKPENVMLGDFGEVYLVDWGIAARTGTSTGDKLAGTPHYLAPEMVGGTVDARTDVYLLGATLHEILTGTPPHSGGSLTAVLYAAFVSEVPLYAADVPEELADLARGSMARDPDARPQSARAFGEALDDFVRHRGSRALSRTGEARLAALREQVEGVSPDERDLGELRRLVAECRFAFQEAGREWPDNPAVGPGLDACLRLAVRVEIDRRDGEAARAMLREIEAPDAELVHRVEQLEEDLVREAAEHSRLEKLAKDLDPSVERGFRAVGAAVIGALMVAIGFYARSVPGFTKMDVFRLGAGLLVILAVLLVLFWRRINSTTFNRRLAAWVGIGSTSIVAHRLLALFDDSATAVSVLTTDFVIAGAFWAFGSIFLYRWMLLVGVALGLSTIPALLYPDQVATLFSTVNLLAVATFFVGWRRGQLGDDRLTS